MPCEMRDSNRSAFRGHGRLLAPIIVIGLLVVACGGGDATPAPTGPALATTPSPTPDLHLASPATLEAVFRGIQEAGLKVDASTGGSGEAGQEPLHDLVATYAGWPLIISQYSTAKAMAKAKRWKAGKRPGQGEPPIAIRGLNILVEWGPTTGGHPPKLDSTQQAAMDALIAALDPMLYPLSARTSVPVELPVHGSPVSANPPATSASPAPSLKSSAP
jgi:hypothetical protein